MDYEYTDRVIAYVDKQLIQWFSRLKSLVSFDELNVLQEVNAVYRDIGEMVRRVFLRLANQVYRENLQERTYHSLTEQWLDDLLTAYDPVSKYVFAHEWDRKRARLIEAIIASDTKTKEIEAALRSLSFMCRIYAVRITDEAVLQAFEDMEEELVRWVSEHDERTCTICYQRDGKVYKIEFLPPKPHPNCRCRYERIDVRERPKRIHAGNRPTDYEYSPARKFRRNQKRE